ncbi:nitronate monooxygenase [Propioniciclava sinopodophylli]|uniref:nitronate monooxygenase n=1 Tax=Propioniciclava sinopodophylli TaxID=1837344 RepID=UPI0024925E46|nr:nitronate monooxygenase [Propioniciclava sinopodophylli]
MPQHPTIIQGGMGVAVSSWRLANAVARAGQLGVVSGTGLDGVVARVLQDGDPGGHVRRALAHFPVPEIAERVMNAYYLPEGRAEGQPYRPHPTLTIAPTRAAIELSLVGNFAEVWLAKEGHDGVVGINFLQKIQTATLSATLGGMLAGVDYVLMGAGIPKEMPRVLTEFAAGRPGRMTIEVDNQTKIHTAVLDPVTFLGEPLPPMRRPEFLAIISLHVLGGYLARDPEIRPDGFVVEGPVAGGHSAPPRGKLILDELGQPIYSPKDDADIAKMVALGLPFWMAGAWSTPERVAEAIKAGAQGVQCGTIFALASESGLTDAIRGQLLEELRAGTLQVKNDALASPTGFPFKVARLDGTLSEQEVYEARNRICDLGYLRQPAETPDGKVVYRCASEPVHMYVKKGGDIAETVGRKCLCNALFANIGMPQRRKDGYVEDPAITLGSDLTGARGLLAEHPAGWTGTEAVTYLLRDAATGAA